MKQRFVIFAALNMSLMLSMSAFGAVSYVSSGDSGGDGFVIASAGQTNGGATSGNGSLAPNATPVPTTKSFNILKNPSWADLGNSGFSPLPVPYTTDWVSFLSSPTPGSAIGNSNLTTGVEQWVDFYHVFCFVFLLLDTKRGFFTECPQDILLLISNALGREKWIKKIPNITVKDS